MRYHLGVDLGTTFTAAAISRGNRTEVVTLGARKLEVPSVAFLGADGELLLAEAADRRRGEEPRRFVSEFKRRLGDATPILLGTTPFAAESLTAKLLRWVVDAVVDREGGLPESIVVTRPANWDRYKQGLLAAAVDQAELVNATTVSEPQAAAVHYASTTRVAIGDTVGVYDLGGGTFDASVLRKTATGFSFLGDPIGVERLGGMDFDEVVFAHVTTQLGTRLGELDNDDPQTLAALRRLRRECTEAKEALSADTETTIQVALPGWHTEVRLTRREFERMIKSALAETVHAFRRALRSADVEPEDLKVLVLVGGSSRIPLVAQLLGDELGRPVAVDVHPKHAVALGAAEIAASSQRAAPAPPPVAKPRPQPTYGSTRTRTPAATPSPTLLPDADRGLSVPVQPAATDRARPGTPARAATVEPVKEVGRLGADVVRQQRRQLGVLAVVLVVFLVILIAALAVLG